MPIVFIAIVFMVFMLTWVLLIGAYKPIGVLFSYVVKMFKDGMNDDE